MAALEQSGQTATGSRRVELAGPVQETGAAGRAVLGLDIGGTKLAVAVVTEDGAVHGYLSEPTQRDDGPDEVIAHLFDMGGRALTEVGMAIDAVGISCGGPLDAPGGVLLCPPHLPGWVDVPIGPRASDEFGVPFALENDATAGALAEHRYGVGRGVRNMIYLTLSTGVGGGAIIDGRVYRGAAGNGGEFGHVTVQRGGRICSCGRRGCLEAYVSGTSIAARAIDALAEDGSSSLNDCATVTAAEVVRAAAAGDGLSAGLWAETVGLLGAAVTDMVNILEPDMVVLGGGVTRSGAMVLEPVRAVVGREAMGPAARAVRVELAELGDAVCVVGAGAVAMESATPSGSDGAPVGAALPEVLDH